MNFAQKLANFFQAPRQQTQGKTPEEICPNCWGHQEWDSQIRQMIEDRQIDINNGLDHYTFIKNFMVQRVEGIHLQPIKEETLQCPTCETVYINRNNNLMQSH